MNEIILNTEGLCVSYGKNNILKNIDASFEKNKITAIIGPSGCGKSTFLKSLNKTVEEYGGNISGSIIFNNKNINDMPLQRLRNSIGMVFQNPVVFPFSIYKNMTYAPIYYGEKNKDRLNNIVVDNLKKANLYEEVKDDLNMPASRLSGGQQQRLVIARCLTVNPEIILLDEPCSALDIKNTSYIEKMLLELKNEYTIIIVTHNLAQAKRIADCVMYMEDGTLVEMGSPDEIFNNPVDSRTKEYIMYMNN
ncbi:phosphate ABC transporter ATP-binding protein [Sedimentibacter sp. B4]|uniref:phosphate ABC transporter ATP-binding protein n=1 Tax=Sedimentibacter sp. B4 TaxID=304766 RepID=UPI0002FD1C45|nr:phosphate ABC transporter ATP-binding protein [Sedimentibacter sp. B4]